MIKKTSNETTYWHSYKLIFYIFLIDTSNNKFKIVYL